MADENPREHPPSKTHRTISILIPVLPILLLTYFAIFNHQFREYITETAYEGFYLAKEGFEMLEFMVIVLGGIVILVVFYLLNVLKLKKFTKEHQETILGFINNEKSLILLGIVMLLLCILVYAPYQKYKNDQETIKKFQVQLTNKKTKPAQPKPLPETIIPKPEEPPKKEQVAVAEKPEPIKDQQEFETNDIGTGDADIGFIDKAIADKEAKKKAEIAAQIEANQSMWTNSLPYYHHGLESLRDFLIKISTEQGDGVAQSEGYFQSLPPVIDQSTGILKIAEIRFQKNTNWDFNVFIRTDEDGKRRTFRVICKGGRLDAVTDQGGGNFLTALFDSSDQIFDSQSSGIGDYKKIFDTGIRLLIAEQARYIKRHKSDTNIIDKP